MGMMSNIAAKIKPALQQAQANKGSGFARAAANAIKANRPMKKGGSVGSASKRADGCCVKGKTRGKML